MMNNTSILSKTHYVIILTISLVLIGAGCTKTVAPNTSLNSQQAPEPIRETTESNPARPAPVDAGMQEKTYDGTTYYLGMSTWTDGQEQYMQAIEFTKPKDWQIHQRMALYNNRIGGYNPAEGKLFTLLPQSALDANLPYVACYRDPSTCSAELQISSLREVLEKNARISIAPGIAGSGIIGFEPSNLKELSLPEVVKKYYPTATNIIGGKNGTHETISLTLPAPSGGYIYMIKRGDRIITVSLESKQYQQYQKDFNELVASIRIL